MEEEERVVQGSLPLSEPLPQTPRAWPGPWLGAGLGFGREGGPGRRCNVPETSDLKCFGHLPKAS